MAEGVHLWPRSFVCLVLALVATVLVLNLFICCNLDKLVSLMGFPGGTGGKELTGDIRDMGLTPGLGRCLGGGHGILLQYSCLESPMDRGTWWATVHWVAESCTRLKHAHSELYKSAAEKQKKHPKVLLHEISGSS